MPSLPTSIAAFLPQGLPQSNLLIAFGALLAFGTLGGMLAARLRWLPTITGFMALGLLIGPGGFGLLSQSDLDGAQVLVDIALGLILFRLGTTLHPWAVMRNRTLVVTSLVESAVTFLAILILMWWAGAAPVVAVIAAAIAVSSSPAVLLHVADELRAAGPVTKAAEALVAMNNVLAFVLFSLALPMALRSAQVEIGAALLVPAYQLLGALVVGLVVAWVVTRIALQTRVHEQHFRFALVVGAVTLAIGLAVAFKVSTLFTALTLGVACRWMQGRSRLTRVEFGGGGDVFFIILFAFAGANLHFRELAQSASIAAAYVAVRSLAKVVTLYGCGRVFGYTHRQSVSTGLLMVPMAGLAIGLAHTTRALAPEVGAQVFTVVLSAVAVFETIGPPIAAFALRFAGEAGRAGDSLTAKRAGPAPGGATPDGSPPPSSASTEPPTHAPLASAATGSQIIQGS